MQIVPDPHYEEILNVLKMRFVDNIKYLISNTETLDSNESLNVLAFVERSEDPQLQQQKSKVN
jgi:hypothetical protein